MKCNHCIKDFEEKQIQEHHLHPKFMDNKKGLGMKLNLCEKDHTILHLTIPAILWKYVINKEECLKEVKQYTWKYCNKKEEVIKDGDSETIPRP